MSGTTLATSKSRSEREPISYICHWSNEGVLNDCLKDGLRLGKNDELILLNGYESLSAGYAAGEAKASHNLLVFLHQDVILHDLWSRMLHQELRKVNKRDPRWAIAGVFGCEWKFDGSQLTGIDAIGCGWDLGGKWGASEWPRRVDVLDSCVLVKRKGPPLFDPEVPTFHGAAEDICLSAAKLGRSVWVVGVETGHRSQRKKSVDVLEGEIEQCARYLVNKWGCDIPSATRVWEHSLAVLQHRSVNEVCEEIQAATV